MNIAEQARIEAELLRPGLSGGVSFLERPGTGVPLVALHGIGSNAAGFGLIVPHLAPDTRFITWSAPGYGASAPLEPDWPATRDYADALAGLLDRLGLDKVRLLGHSLGTLMGASFARHHPDRVAALVLASCAIGQGRAPGSALTGGALERIEALTTQGPQAFAAARAPRLVWQPAGAPDSVALVAHNMAQVQMPGYGQAVRMLASADILADLAHVRVPVSLIVGSEDLITPVENSRRAHAALPATSRGPLVELPNLGHAIYQQGPRVFVQALRACYAITAPDGTV